MQKITELRKSLGLSQDELAQMAGVSRAAVSMAESGHRAIPNALLVKLGEIQRRLNAQVADDLVVPEQFVAEFEAQRKEVQKGLDKLIQQHDKTRERLNRMEFNYRSAALALEVAAREHHLFADVPSYLSKIEASLQAAMDDRERNHPVRQQLIRLKLAEQEACIALRTQWLQDNPPMQTSTDQIQ
jgi:transcriptional regulator with XRE-family HTH domain